MSGGPYGRDKAPERECMKRCNWPDEDQRRWREALAPVDPFVEGSGARAHHSPRSNVKAEKGHGRFLTYLKLFEPEALNKSPANRLTPQRIRAYVQHLRDIGNGSGTILCRLQELREIARVFDANNDWSFINEIASRVRAKHQPVRDKSNLRLSDELLELGFELISRAKIEENIEAAILFRDGLIIAFESLMPIRRRNLADFKMGRNLTAINNKLLVTFDATETKTQAPFEVDWPECLIEPLEEYLEKYRPVLVAQTGRWHKPADDYLWISKDGSPMTQMAIYDRFRLRTKNKFGVAINPHLFRDAAATTMALAAPGQVRLSAPLLGHRTLSTTEKYYQQATGYEAHKVYVQAVFGKGD
jgi:integrase/recombinase XerD